MRRIAFLVAVAGMVAGVVAGRADEQDAPVFGIKIPPGYRPFPDGFTNYAR